MRIVSLTGRPWNELDRVVIERAPKIGVLTDRRNTPAAIADRLLEFGYTAYTMYVGERLGNATLERVRRLSLDEARTAEFDMPNCVMLCAEGENGAGVRPFGIPDDAFELLDGRRRMITKMPIRLLSLQALELSHRSVMWDVGFCTGSVSIEARLLFPAVKVFSFEIRPDCEEIMHVNTRRFGTPGIEMFIGDFMETDLSAIPSPDAVFIGGHGGRLNDMLGRINERLLRGGCVVFNSVSDESRTMFEAACRDYGLVLLEPMHLKLNDYNAITIMKAVKV